MDVLVYLNAQHHMVALGVQGISLPTPYGGTSSEWINKTVKFWKLWKFRTFENTGHKIGEKKIYFKVFVFDAISDNVNFLMESKWPCVIICDIIC